MRFIVVVYFVIDSVRKLLDTPSHTTGTHYTKSVLRYCQHHFQAVYRLLSHMRHYHNRCCGTNITSRSEAMPLG